MQTRPIATTLTLLAVTLAAGPGLGTAAQAAEPATTPAERRAALDAALQAAAALPPDERGTAGWRLAERFEEVLDESTLLDLLFDTPAPAALDVLHGALRCGAGAAWRGARLSDVLALLESASPERRRCAAKLIAADVRRRTRGASRRARAARAPGTRATPADDAAQQEADSVLQSELDALERALRRGDDAALRGAGEDLGKRPIPLSESLRAALRTGASQARTHAGRVAAVYALARTLDWSQSEDVMLAAWHQGESSPAVRLAIADGQARVWEQRSSLGMFQAISPLFETYLAEAAGDAGVRRRLLEAWVGAGWARHGSVIASRLRELAEVERDALLRGALLRVAQALEAGALSSSFELDAVFRGD